MRQQEGLNKNGLNKNGLNVNGLNVNGLNVNGLNVNGLNVNGGNPLGLGANGIGPFGIEFKGLQWDPPSNSWLGPAGADIGLSNFINNNDTDGSGGTPNQADRDLSLSTIAYVLSCMCPPGVSPTVTAWNPYTNQMETETFWGGSGDGPTWCMGTGVVPEDEIAFTSACIYSRVNTLGIHNTISERGFNSYLKLGSNEGSMMTLKTSRFRGNLFRKPKEQQDPTDGNWYTPSGGFVCHNKHGILSPAFEDDVEAILGRGCWRDGSCSGLMHGSGYCDQPGDPTTTPAGDGASWTGKDAWNNPVTTWDPADVLGGGIDGSLGYPDITDSQQFFGLRGKQSPGVIIYLGAVADVDWSRFFSGQVSKAQCNPNCVPGGEATAEACHNPGPYENCTTLIGQSTPLGLPQIGPNNFVDCMPSSNCVGGKRITGLTPGQIISVSFTKGYYFDVPSASWLANNSPVESPKAASVIIQYSSPAGASVMRLSDPNGINDPVLVQLPDSGGPEIYRKEEIYPWYAAAVSSPRVGIDVNLEPAPSSSDIDFFQIHPGPPPSSNLSPREMWTMTLPGPLAVPEGGGSIMLNLNVAIGSPGGTDIGAMTKIRIRPHVSGVPLSELKVKSIHQAKTATLMTPGLPPSGNWSAFAQASTLGTAGGGWNFQVSDAIANGSGGMITAIDLEIVQ